MTEAVRLPRRCLGRTPRNDRILSIFLQSQFIYRSSTDFRRVNFPLAIHPRLGGFGILRPKIKKRLPFERRLQRAWPFVTIIGRTFAKNFAVRYPGSFAARPEYYLPPLRRGQLPRRPGARQSRATRGCRNARRASPGWMENTRG